MDITHALLTSGLEGSSSSSKEGDLGVKWEGKSGKAWDAKHRCLVLRFSAPVGSLVWHHKGDYLGTVVPTAASKAVMIHQVGAQPARQADGQQRQMRGRGVGEGEPAG